MFVTLQKQGCLPAAHQLSGLALFVDQQGLLRLGGRLQKAGLPTEHTFTATVDCLSHCEAAGEGGSCMFYAC